MKEKIIRRTFSIPESLKKKLDRHPEVNWPEVAKKILENKLEKLEKLQARGEL